jgi:hypothetical protein
VQRQARGCSDRIEIIPLLLHPAPAAGLEAKKGEFSRRRRSPPSPSLASLRAAAPASVACFRSSLSLSLPFLPLSVPVDSAAVVVPGALRWGRRRTWGCGWWSAAWSASWRYKSGEQGRRTTGPRFAGDEDLTGGTMPSYSPPFPSCCGYWVYLLYSDLIMILLIPSVCSSYWVSYAGPAPD